MGDYFNFRGLFLVLKLLFFGGILLFFIGGFFLGRGCAGTHFEFHSPVTVNKDH